MRSPTILVVESDDELRRQISAWLQDAGYSDVMFCPGPASPDYTCLGGRGSSCPLATAADVVAVDLKLRSDDLMRGTPGWQLLLYYYQLGKQIVAFSAAEDSVRPWPDDQVHVIARPIDREDFLAAMRAALNRTSSHRGNGKVHTGETK